MKLPKSPNPTRLVLTVSSLSILACSNDIVAHPWWEAGSRCPEWAKLNCSDWHVFSLAIYLPAAKVVCQREEGNVHALPSKYC
jgi:hypothetical protein